MIGLKNILTNFWQVIKLWTEANFAKLEDFQELAGQSVDQTFGPTSTHAQSGTAVAQAIDGRPKVFNGLKADWDELTLEQKTAYDMANFSDDEGGGEYVVDIVQDDNLNPVTSNAVFNYKTETIENNNNIPVTSSAVFNYKIDSVTKGNKAPVTSNAVFSRFNVCSHNVPRFYASTVGEGKDITEYFNDGSLYSRLNGTDGYQLFEDIYVGDFFDMGRTVTITDSTNGAIGSRWVTVAGIDTLAGNGDTVDMWYHHLVLVPGKGGLGANEGSVQHFGQHSMNSTDTTVGGYVGSWMYTTGLSSINTQLESIFGDHLKSTRELLTNDMNANLSSMAGLGWTGCATNWAWYDCKSVLMSEVEVYGSTVFSSSAFDTGNANQQLPLFRFSTRAQNNRTAWYWLKSLASSSDFCCSSGYGDSGYGGASSSGGYVRPRFVIAA